MTGYILRRLLLMVPTFIGILLINFVVLRLQGPTLVDQMQASSGKASEGGAGERKAATATKDVEVYIDRFRRAGLDLPALVNTRGFWDKKTVIAALRDVAANGPYADKPSVRNRGEKELWLAGRFAVMPLVEVLRDETVSDLHAPASTALTFCAYISVTPLDAERLPTQELASIQSFNEMLRANRISYENRRDTGFVSVDPEAVAKRQTLLAVFDQPGIASRYRLGKADAWAAVLADTGFVDIMGKLFTGNMYSETRKDYAFSIIADRWYISFWFNITAILIAWGVSIPLGIRSARRLGTLEDRATTTSLFLLWSLPSYFVGTLLLYHFCTEGSMAFAWFPNRGLPGQETLWVTTSEWVWRMLWHAALPLLVLSYASFTALSRYMRGNLLEQLDADYVRTARAKGCDEDRVVYRHSLRNSLITMITLGGGLLAELFGGSMVVELIFSIPGLGSLTLDAARQNDAPLLMASTVISVSLLLVGILIADLLYAVVDPRLRSRYA